MDCFDRCIAIVIDTEGGFTNNPADPGNWTGGYTGGGACRGTKFGISAAAYPDLAISALTLSQAKALYRHDYWDKVAGDHLPQSLALLVFDAAVNNGLYHAAVWLQQAAGTHADGVIGPVTLEAVTDAAARPEGTAALCSEFLARRLLFMTALVTWPAFKAGWTRRLFRLPYQSSAFDK